MIKQKFLNNPSVMTIGDGYNDSYMMKFSDVAF